MPATLFSGSADQELLLSCEHLVTKNRILKNQINGRLQPTDPGQISLAEINQRLGRRALAEIIPFREDSLRHHLENYVNHFRAERNHQGKGNVILLPALKDRIGKMPGDIQIRERPGGLLNVYRRKAA